MARQNNLLRLSGSVGEMVHYERNGQFFTRTKPVKVNQSENSRKASVEFGRASAAASMLMKGFHPLLKIVPHTSAYHRLTSAFYQMMHRNTSKAIGKRMITEGDPSPLHQFRFNDACSIDRLLKIQLPPIRVVPKSSICFDLPSFCVQDVCPEKTNAEAIRIQLICMVSDFLLDEGNVFYFDELDIAIENKSFEGGAVSIPLNGTNHKLVVWGMSIHYLGKNLTPYQNKKSTAFDIIDVLLIKKGERVVFTSPEKVVKPVTAEKVERLPWKFKKTKGLD
jgi:hypothetical protein